MIRYGLKKLLEMFLTLFIVVTIVFFFVRMIPGDPARMIAGEQATLEDVENVREALVQATQRVSSCPTERALLTRVF